mgnify:CR=1 FL=1
MEKSLKAKVFNRDGKVKSEIDLAPEIFGVRWNPHLVRLALVRAHANERNVVASTKNRGQVDGSTKKVWRQKHTGRARQGSIRAPHWVGGGVAFGPTPERNFTKRLPKKERRQAIFSMLSKIYSEERIKFIEDITFDVPKTKLAIDVIKNLSADGKNLWILGHDSYNFALSLRNIPKQTIILPSEIGIKDLVYTNHVLISENSLKEVYNIFLFSDSDLTGYDEEYATGVIEEEKLDLASKNLVADGGENE